MTARWSVVLVLAGIAAGYAVGGSPTSAQSVGDAPIAIGDRVTLTFDYAGQPLSSVIDCAVVELQTGFVRCAAADRFKTGREHTWYSLRPVVRIVKQDK